MEVKKRERRGTVRVSSQVEEEGGEKEEEQREGR